MTKTKPLLFGSLIVLGAVCVVLLLTGKRVLVAETKVEPGQNYVLPEWGSLGDASQSQLVCRYFTGRSMRTTVLWYSPNNIMGKDQCPFIDSQN